MHESDRHRRDAALRQVGGRGSSSGRRGAAESGTEADNRRRAPAVYCRWADCDPAAARPPMDHPASAAAEYGRLLPGETHRAEQVGASAVRCIGPPVGHDDRHAQRCGGPCEWFEYASLVWADAMPEKHNRLWPGCRLCPARPVDVEHLAVPVGHCALDLDTMQGGVSGQCHAGHGTLIAAPPVLALSVILTAADPRRVGAVSGFGEADRAATRPQEATLTRRPGAGH
jgi:hypothetical protein